MLRLTLTSRLRNAGIAAADIRTSVWEIWDVFPLRDGRVANLASLAEGRTFTHPLSPEEVDEQRLPLRDDLGLFLTFIPPALTLATGGHADIRMWKGPLDLDKLTSLFGPSGWLGDAVTDDLLAVTLTDGVLSLKTIARETLPDEHSDEVAQSLRQTFEALASSNLHGGPFDVPELLIETIVRHPESFVTPVEPVSSLLERVDLFEEDDGVVVDLTGEFEFAADDPSPVQDIYSLDDKGVDALDDLHDAVHVLMSRPAIDLGSDAEDVDAASEDPEGVRNDGVGHGDGLPPRALLAALRHDDRVALALADEVLGVHVTCSALTDCRSHRPHGPQIRDADAITAWPSIRFRDVGAPALTPRSHRFRRSRGPESLAADFARRRDTPDVQRLSVAFVAGAVIWCWASAAPARTQFPAR